MEMNTYRKSQVLGIVVVLMTLYIMIPVQPAKAQFVIAFGYETEGFDYDEYGQGFYSYTLVSNKSAETGIESDDFDVVYGDYDSIYYFNQSSYSIEGLVGYFLGIHFLCWMNSTLTGATDLDDGRNYIRTNATISAYGVELDSYEDITPFYQTSYFDAEMWLYGFKAHFNVLPTEGMIYVISLTYEVYW